MNSTKDEIFEIEVCEECRRRPATRIARFACRPPLNPYESIEYTSLKPIETYTKPVCRMCFERLITDDK